MKATEEFLKKFNGIEPQYGTIEITFEGLCRMLEQYHYEMDEANKKTHKQTKSHELDIDRAFEEDEKYNSYFE